jgi:hypothetical protein
MRVFCVSLACLAALALGCQPGDIAVDEQELLELEAGREEMLEVIAIEDAPPVKEVTINLEVRCLNGDVYPVDDADAYGCSSNQCNLWPANGYCAEQGGIRSIQCTEIFNYVNRQTITLWECWR